jgi:hypothetical protein
MDRCPTCHRKHKRGNPANARLWALYHEMAAKPWPDYDDDGVQIGWVRHSAETFHIYYKSRFLGCDDFSLPNGKTLSIPRSTANLDVAEFSAYMDQVEADAALRGVFLADLETA